MRLPVGFFPPGPSKVRAGGSKRKGEKGGADKRVCRFELSRLAMLGPGLCQPLFAPSAEGPTGGARGTASVEEAEGICFLLVSAGFLFLAPVPKQRSTRAAAVPSGHGSGRRLAISPTFAKPP